MNRAVADFFLKFNNLHSGFKSCHYEGSSKAAVIVESRDSHLLYEVIKEHMVHLGADWNLHIFLTEANRLQVTSLLSGWKYTLHVIDTYQIDQKFFSVMCKNEAFWDSIPEENILMFQYDSVLFRGLPEDIYQYDMVGSPCGLNTLNGGLSFRKKSAMLRVIRSDAGQKRINENPHENEDMFFTDLLRDDPSSKIPTMDEARRYFVESHVNPNAVGAHGTDKPYMAGGTTGWTTMLCRQRY